MALTTIEWTAYLKECRIVPGYTFNPWEGCEKVSPGCANCYAEARDKRLHKGGHWGPKSERLKHTEKYWRQLYKWDDEAAALGEKRIVFVASLADWLEDRPELDDYRIPLLYAIRKTQNLIYMCLTKRPEKFSPIMRRIGQRREFPGTSEMARQWVDGIWPNNVWIGATAENQEWYDKRRPFLSQIPAEKRFWSIEPMLGPIDMNFFVDFVGGSRMKRDDASDIDLVVCGGESGNGARPFDPQWARSVKTQCEEAGINFFMKQLGANPVGIERLSKKGNLLEEMPADLRVRQLPI